ncbi:MAG: hypothetical protein HYS32_01660 [Candidatus Woesearchaeota archaeon]|nr:MAG: hypothetical protein HYS32_01660 [Candidatus Woesearchaeota archaeon]
MVSKLATALQFLEDFGLFDIILPFFLVFTLVFAILEKTRVLGEEDGKPKKNLNAMVGFVVGLLVVATASVVQIFNKALPNVIILLVVSVFFLILIGTFMASGELNFKATHGNWYWLFFVLLLLGILLIFLAAVPFRGENFLVFSLDWIKDNFGGAAFGSIVILIISIFAIWFITSSGKKEEKGGKG